MIKIKNIDFRLICVGILIFSYLLRTKIVGTKFAYINVLAFAGILLLYFRIKKRQDKIKIFSKNEKIIDTMLIMIMMLIFIMTNKLSIEGMSKYFIATFLPILILFIPISKEDLRGYVNTFCKFLIVICTFIVLCALLDMILKTDIAHFFTKFYRIDSLELMNATGRLVSYLGHPLLTTEIMLICFSFNAINNIYLKKKEKSLSLIYCTAICFLGIILSASKTGIFLFAIEFILIYLSPKKAKYLIIACTFFYILYSVGLLDTIINRIYSGYVSGDISTGRNIALKELTNSKGLSFFWFKGHENIFTTNMIAALEYPILKWAYLFGNAFSIILAFIIFLQPIIKIAQISKNKILLIALILVIDVNTYNGITNNTDHMLIYCISMWLILNIIYYLKDCNKDQKGFEIKNDEKN